MRIVIDARNITPPRINGLGRYALNLVRSIAALDRDNEYILVKRTRCTDTLVKQENFREISVEHDIASLRNSFFPLPEVNALAADIFHTLYSFFPAGLRVRKRVLTLHDLMYLECPFLSQGNWAAGVATNIYARIFLGASIRSSDHVIAISEATREKAVARFSLDPAKVTAIHHGVDPSPGVPAGRDSLPEPLRSGRYILAIGNTRPYKNIPGVFRAFSELGPAHRDVVLAVAGRSDHLKSLRALAGALKISDRVCFTGFVDDATRDALYAGAECLAFPSLYEGFGMPIVEAMQRGCPVLTSEYPPMSEITGDAAQLVDPRDPESIAAGMSAILSDSRLRQSLISKGVARAARFTWERAAEETLRIYRSV